LGPAIDAAIRHQLVLRGITTGQRVPEDWEPAVAANLVRMSMRTVPVSAFDPNTSDLGFFFSQSANRSTLTQGRLDA
jgi:flagellar biosynthesis protein FlhF